MTEITLTTEMVWVLVVLALTIFLFVSEIVRVDVTAITIMVLLGVTGLVEGDEVFSGFASNAVISIIAVMILGAGLDKTGVMKRVAEPIVRLAGGVETRLIALISGTVGVISSFMQNIGAAALFLPAVKRVATQTNLPLTHLLMPMGFCAIMGGTLTLVGSSPLILLNDLIESSNAYLPEGVDKMAPFELFDVTPVGLALVTTGIVYFVLLGRYILPHSSDTTPPVSNTLEYFTRTYGIQGDIFEVTVRPDGKLEGRTMDYIREKSAHRVNVLAVSRDGELQFAPPPDMVFRAGDVVALIGPEEDVRACAEHCDLDMSPTLTSCADIISPNYAGLAEIVIPPRSNLVGKTTRDVNFRQRYKGAVVAIYRGEKSITEHIPQTPLQVGDALLVHIRWEDLAILEQDKDFIVVSDFPHQDVNLRPEKIRHALLFFAMAVGLVLFTDLRLSVAFMAGAVGMILTGVLRIDEAYKSVDWRTVFLLAGLIPLGIAVDQSGTAAWIAHHVVAIMGDVPGWVMLLTIAVLATAFTLVMSNVGATVLLVPLAVNIAIDSGGDPRIFALVVGLATSNSFILPTHQVNALIMGAAGYRNKDFLRAGGLMSILFLAVMMLMLTLFY